MKEGKGMEKANVIKKAVFGIIGVVGSVIANALGGWDMFLQVLIGCMAVDFVSGLIVAGVFKKSNKTETGALASNASWRGLAKKGMTLLIIYVATLVDKAAGTNIIRNAVIIGYIANEALSILENAGLMGLWVPQILKDAIDVLRKKSEGGSNGN